MQLGTLLKLFHGDSEEEDSEFQELRDRVEKWVTQKWSEIKNAYSVYHQNVWRARLFMAGEFWIELNEKRQYWQPKQMADDYVPTPRINRFAPAIESVSSNFATIPEVEAVPFPKDSEYAMGIAEAVNDLITYFIKENALRADYKSKEDLAGDAAMSFVLSGCAFTEVFSRNVKAGSREKLVVSQNKSWKCTNCDIYEEGLSAGGVCPVCGGGVEEIEGEGVEPEKDERGNPVMEDVIQKETCVDLVDPLHAFPRPGSTRMANTPYIIRAQRRTLDEIHERWNYKAEADAEYPDSFNLDHRNRLNYYYVGYNQETSENRDSALVIEAYCEPGKMMDFPGGFYAVVVNRKCIYFQPWADEFDDHPLTMGAYQQLNGVFFPRTVAFDLCETQSETCDYESIIKLHGMTSAVEPIVIDENTVVSQVTGRADKIIRWRAVGAHSKEPHRMKHGSLDEGIYRQRDQLIEDMENISASVEVMRGKQPGSVTANVAIQTLRSQAELQYARPVSNWTALWKETVRKGIKAYQSNYTFTQLVDILGEDRIAQIEDFIACNLDTCIEFKATSTGMPRTREEKRQEFIDMYDRNALDLTDLKVREKIFELFGETGAMGTFNEDARRARKNIRGISKGVWVDFRIGIDDPQVHLGIALEAAKKLEFDRWNDTAKVMLYTYIEKIRQGLAAMMPAATAGPQPGDAPPGGPAPGAPVQGGSRGATAQGA